MNSEGTGFDKCGPGDNDDSFSLDELIDDLATTQSTERALSLCRMLLVDGFGEKFGMTTSDCPDRVFPVEQWTECQRKILHAVAQCEPAWPEVAFAVHVALELEFDPDQQELINALAGTSNVPKSATEEEEDETPTDFSDSAVLAAIRRLFESFSLGHRSLDRELKRFEPFRPYAAVGVGFLIDKLKNATVVDERRSAAWALGRLGEHAAHAAEALFEQIEHDPENEYAGYALEEIPVSAELVEKICDKIESDQEGSAIYDYRRIIGNQIRTSRLMTWLDESPWLRWEALARLGDRCPDQIRNHLLLALDDEDENIAEVAKSALGNAKTAEWLFDDIHTLTRNQQFAIADALVSHGADLSKSREQLFAAVGAMTDGQVAAKFVALVSAFDDKTEGDAASCVGLLEQFDSSIWKLELIQVLKNFVGKDCDEVIIAGLSRLLQEANEFVRSAAAETLGRFTGTGDCVSQLLRDAWIDKSERVQRAVLWSLVYRGTDAEDFLLARLLATRSDRVRSEVIWALDSIGRTADVLGLEWVSEGQFPLSENVLAAIRSKQAHK